MNEREQKAWDRGPVVIERIFITLFLFALGALLWVIFAEAWYYPL